MYTVGAQGAYAPDPIPPAMGVYSVGAQGAYAPDPIPLAMGVYSVGAQGHMPLIPYLQLWAWEYALDELWIFR